MPLSLLALSCLLLSSSFTSAASVGGDDDSHAHHEVLLRRARRNPREEWVTGAELRTRILGGSVLFSQNSLSCTTQDNIPLETLANNIRNGWQGQPVRAVSYNGGRVWVMLDHRRTVAGALTGSPYARIKVRVYEQTDMIAGETASNFVARRIGNNRSELAAGALAFDANGTRVRGRSWIWPTVRQLLAGSATVTNEPGCSYIRNVRDELHK